MNHDERQAPRECPGGRIALWSLWFVLLLCDRSLAQVQPTGSDNVLIRNVVLFDPEGEKEDALVNILVQGGELEVVTQDKVAASVAELVVDAREGILMGRLELGERPSFLILSGDPREEFRVLLNTERFATFAMEDGRVVRNRLWQGLDPSQDSDQEPARGSGWFSYTPPPLSLPTSYRDSSSWNRWDTKYVSGLFLGAIVLDRQNWMNQDATSRSQVGDLDDFSGGELRGLRFGAVGTLNFSDPWTYTVFAATNAFDKGFDTTETDSLSLFDLRVDIPTPASTTLSLGKQKEPISLERTTGLIYLPMQERSAVADALLPARNVGAVLSGNGFDQDVSWAAGLFNDWLENGGDVSEGSNQVVGRVTWLPWVAAGESTLLHLGLGARYSDAREGLAYATEPEFNQSPTFVDTGLLQASNSLTYDVEASWLQGPLWLAGEYIWNDLGAADLGNPRMRGHYLSASWALTGELREYNRKSGIFSPLPIANSVRENGWGAWEANARWSTLDTNDAQVTGGDLEVYSLGLTWWLTPTFNVSCNYRWIDLDDGVGGQGRSDGFATRIVLMLE